VAFRLEGEEEVITVISENNATEALLSTNNRLLGHLNVELKVKNVSENLLLSFVSIVSYLLDF